MGSMWESIVDNYTYLIDDLAHPLTKGWLLATSPVPVLVILVTYNVFCIKIGPALMQNRPPFKLDLIIRLYNIFQVLISLYLFHEGIVYIFSGNFNFKCQGIDDDGLRVASGINVYLYTKLTELLDTVFFVLRKSYRQITFLHLYHHTLMPIVTWVGIKYFPGGQGVIFGILNSLVHVVMYTYYFIAGLGPEYQKYLWWKKYLTVMQIVQFVIVFLHSFNSMFYSCDYFPILKVLTMLFAAIFINMFSKFYYYTYIVKRKSGKSDEIKTTLTNGEHTEKEESNKNPIRHRNGFNKDSAVNGDSTKNKYTNGISNGNSRLNDIPSDHEKMKSL